MDEVEFEEAGPEPHPPVRPMEPIYSAPLKPRETQVTFSYNIFTKQNNEYKLTDLLDTENVKIEDLWCKRSRYNTERWLLSFREEKLPINYDQLVLEYEAYLMRNKAKKAGFASSMANYLVNREQYSSRHVKWIEEVRSVERQRKRKLFFELQEEYQNGKI